MMTTTGEKTFSTTGRTVVNPQTELIPPGTYTLRIGSDATIKKGQKSDSVPRVDVSFEVLGTATTEGGKNRRVFHMLLLSMTPGKDGQLNTDRPGGLTALARCLGTEVEGVEVVMQDAVNDKGEPVKLAYLNPAQVAEWVKSFAGTEVQATIKTQKGTAEYPTDRSIISRFLLNA